MQITNSMVKKMQWIAILTLLGIVKQHFGYPPPRVGKPDDHKGSLNEEIYFRARGSNPCPRFGRLSIHNPSPLNPKKLLLIQKSIRIGASVDSISSQNQVCGIFIFNHHANDIIKYGTPKYTKFNQKKRWPEITTTQTCRKGYEIPNNLKY